MLEYLKKKWYLFVICACLLAALFWLGAVPKQPLKTLTADRIVSAQVQLDPPGETYLIEDADTLAQLLRETVVYHPFLFFVPYGGQDAAFTLTLDNGRTLVVRDHDPFLLIGGVAFVCEFETREALNNYANAFLEEP